MENSVGIVGSIAKLGKNRGNAVELENSVGIVGSIAKLGKNRGNVVGLENSVGIVGRIAKLNKNQCFKRNVDGTPRGSFDIFQ